MGATDPSAVSAGDAASAESRHRGATELSSLTLGDGRRIALTAKGTPPSDHVSPCLRLSGIDHDYRQCGTAPSALFRPESEAPILPDAYAQRDASDRLEVYGSTAPPVTAVRVKYRTAVGRRGESAILLKVTDIEALARAGIGEAFGYFFAELPPETPIETVRAIALDSDGTALGEADFGEAHPQHGGTDAFIAGP